jgi:quinol monooxygenase YgiN
MKTRFWLFALCGLLVGLLSMPIGSAQPLSSSAPAPIHVVGRIQLTLDAQERAEFDVLTQELFKQTLQLDQPTLYTCNEDINTPGVFVWDEIWSSKDALDKHLASPHFKVWWAWVKPHRSGPSQVQYVDQSQMTNL